MFLTGECEIADGDDSPLKLGAGSVPIGKGVELLDISQWVAGLFLDPRSQTGLQRSVLERKRAGGQSVSLSDGEDTRFILVHRDDDRGQVDLSRVGLGSAPAFCSPFCAIAHDL